MKVVVTMRAKVTVIVIVKVTVTWVIMRRQCDEWSLWMIAMIFISIMSIVKVIVIDKTHSILAIDRQGGRVENDSIIRKVRAGQVRSELDRSSQSWSGQVRAGQIMSELVRSGQSWTGQVRAGQVRSGQVRAGQSWSGQVRAGQVRTGQDRSGQVRATALRQSFPWYAAGGYAIGCVGATYQASARSSLEAFLG